ncbi:RPA-interacting protein B-like isoform X2 [Ylistrum balloti]|uniref:RPA-interacting protein B-like isoform X2 n=1 Tax=Ylistrum balloti TaxID=509963 RepID=UPI002905F00E|nr:RPA-interacting protein B-like isoform X2 [Ylistrum balloti]
MSSPAQKVSRNHREMYKAKTPPWKEKYRQVCYHNFAHRCLDRLRQSREKLQAKFRKLGDVDSDKVEDDTFISDLMKEELQGLKESLKQPACKSAEVDDFDMGDLATDIDDVLSLFEDIQAELKIEELKLIEEFERYESSLKEEEAFLCSAIEELCTDEVICPVCQKSPLLINKSVIFCRCGMRVNTEEDCLTLAHVKHLLEEGMTGHTAVCEGQAIFAVVQDLGTQNLLMSCKSCDWMSIVI